jgi:diguanylate cyclase (GGDEF)-like protein
MLRMLRHAPKPLIFLAATLLTLIIGTLDWLTGPEYASSIFYLLPIAAASWYVHLRAGVAMAVLGAGIWVLADILANAHYSSAFVPVWNTAVRLGFFLIVLYLADGYRIKLRTAERQASSDPLTGAANRRSFYDLAQRELAAPQWRGKPVSIAYIDLDNFKRVNDQRGHAEGDEVLKLVVTTLQRDIRGTDVVARLGGDEFALCLPGLERDAAAHIVSRLQEQLLEAMAGAGYPVTFSIGVVTYREVPASFQTMVNDADKIMYEVKATGKNAARFVAVS